MSLVLVLLLACGGNDDDEGGGSTSGATMTSTGSTTGTATTSTGPTTSTTAGSEAGSSGDEAPPTTGEASSGSSGGGESSSGGAQDSTGSPGMCTPDAEDDDCRLCVKMHCCDAWNACRNDDGCACTVDCHLAGGSLNMCENMCSHDGELYQALFFCGQMSCLGTCDWECC